MIMNTYDPLAGTDINTAVEEAFDKAVLSAEDVRFDFNGTAIVVEVLKTKEENVKIARLALGLSEVDPPFHPQTASDALKQWDSGQTVFTIEMGGLGPGYEQAIQVLVFEMIRDNLRNPLPKQSDPEFKAFSDSFGDATVHRIDEKMGGYSGAMVGAAKQIAYRALRDGWEAMLKSAPEDRRIQVSNHIPNLT